MNDQVYLFTRIVAVIVLPFLAVASVLLYLYPTETDRLFAWTIQPPLTALFLASAYVGGIWFFVGVLVSRRWHRIAAGFPAVLAFATLLAIATLLHWDRFHAGHASFITWAVLYLTTPFLIVVAFVLNSRVESRYPDDVDAVIPPLVRAALVVIGLAALAAGVFLFIFPERVFPFWPWELTPLTGRVVGAVLTLPGMVNLWLIADWRWSAFRLLLQAQLVSLAFICLALALARDDLDWSRPVTGWFVSGMVVSFLVYGATYVGCELRRLAMRRRQREAIETEP